MNGGEHAIQDWNVMAYKDKWGTNYGDFKGIFNYMSSLEITLIIGPSFHKEKKLSTFEKKIANSCMT